MNEVTPVTRAEGGFTTLTSRRPARSERAERSRTKEVGYVPADGTGDDHARVEELRREGEAKGREPRGAPRGLHLGLRAALGVRLVSLGCRLLRESVRIQRIEVG
jgi:hypothetical protein